MKYFNQSVRFEDAKKICESKNAKLISIHSSKENEFIRSYVQKQPEYSTKVWIGLKRNDRLQFVWIDKSPYDYINWNIHPVNAVGHYAEMFIDKSDTWNNIENDYKVFVCGFNSKLSISISKTIVFSYFIKHCMPGPPTLTF